MASIFETLVVPQRTLISEFQSYAMSEMGFDWQNPTLLLAKS